MKKMKGVAAAIEFSPYAMYVDQRTRFRHQSLMQDFQDLNKETEDMRKKLQTMKERKLTLLAEVRFLKRRHKFLMQNRSSNAVAGQNFVRPQNTVVRSKSNVKEKKSTGKEHRLRRLATGFDLDRKGKTYSGKETTFIHPSHMFDLNQKQHKNINGKDDVLLQSSSQILDLNQRERLYSGKEAAARTMTPIFDLNQISREEEELQAMDNSMRIKEFKKSSIRIGCDEQHNDNKRSACRNTGNGPNRVGKRKISWQDQVALRV
ncbi:INO80-BINDING PROTEIN 2B [Hibiscus trionum]|uniref:INO80-BINDING PROTEIN 2B n=1 Tax=Hibiscus trionum TaxID=183268 RepID=A0A9W7IH94_HIBTR|nr:INO80-BINDING PROTEIN 2B [Hibiscus trionum]